jgi:N-acetylglucosaminyl-diphospho-decaprenol L-rhamnosyltransferase
MLKDITIIIVAYNSEDLIKKTIKKLSKFKILIIDNSQNKEFKNFIEKQYKNTKYLLSKKNLGFGNALNIGMKLTRTKYCLILNPDAFVNYKTINKLYAAIEKNSAIAAISTETKNNKNKKILNHGYFIFSNSDKEKYKSQNIINVDFFIGYMYLIKTKIAEKVGYFDSKIFLNYEEFDLFKRLKKIGYDICVYKNLYTQHMGGMSHKSKNNSSLDQEIKYTFKWHYAWGMFYFYKKHYNFFIANLLSINFFAKSLIGYFYFFIKNDAAKFNEAKGSVLGLFYSYIGRNSFYRPKI